MPRGPRLDTPGALHHAMARGIERRSIFTDDVDRRDFLDRVEVACARTGAIVYAWALMANHVHFLVRSGPAGISRFLHRVLTGYTVRFNMRHRRCGTLFQNRFKSILVEEEAYLLELVRYIHLNPLRVGIAENMETLDCYPWTGHACLIGRLSFPWQDSQYVLSRFGRSVRRARREYRAFVAAGLAMGRCPRLTGGGLRRSLGGCERMGDLGRGREGWAFDERILGSSEFVQAVIAEVEEDRVRASLVVAQDDHLNRLLDRVSAKLRVSRAELASGTKIPSLVRARAVVSYLALRHLGFTAQRVAVLLGVSRTSVVRGAERGAQLCKEAGLWPEDFLSKDAE